MHLHLPKPLHGWRAFVGEVGIIVIGVLIALGAEQLIERRHWHESAREASYAIQQELAVEQLDAMERLVVQPCLSGQLGALATKLVLTITPCVVMIVVLRRWILRLV